jgi:hypothetical protein
MKAKTTDPMEEEFQYTLNNLWRARRLVDLSKEIKTPKETRSDLLGAAVVFLHATLEEFLRGAALREWFKLDDENLKSALKRYARLSSRNIKISLLDLVDKRQESIESIIQQEVESFLYQDISFNSLDEIEKFLELIKISVQDLKKEIGQEHFDNIQSLIRKRHSVAHQADCSQLDFDQTLVWGKSLLVFLTRLSESLGLNVKYGEELKNISFKGEES